MKQLPNRDNSIIVQSFKLTARRPHFQIFWNFRPENIFYVLRDYIAHSIQFHINLITNY